MRDPNEAAYGLSRSLRTTFGTLMRFTPATRSEATQDKEH